TCGDAGTVQTTSKIPNISRVVTIANTAAMSLLARSVPLFFVLFSQAEVCAGVLADVIRCVLSGSDGCVLGLGCADVVSAIELCCGEEDTLRDLLGEVVPSPGSVQDSPKAHIRVTEDPVYGIQLAQERHISTPDEHSRNFIA
ncbi:hypothetical protein GOODEAATRI_001647, partial [Goodea atripinnis]